jgi:hypothetical protein
MVVDVRGQVDSHMFQLYSPKREGGNHNMSLNQDVQDFCRYGSDNFESIMLGTVHCVTYI